MTEQELYEMDLHEQANINDFAYVRRVVDGWTYIEMSGENGDITSTFVPESEISLKVRGAVAAIKQAMIDDNPSEKGSLAHGWHCTVAMACYDSICDAQDGVDSSAGIMDAGKVANNAASRFMKLCFDVETKG